MSRPNILFLMADQMRWDMLGKLNPHIKTPNLDRLADSGMMFNEMYSPTPVCLPCRASMVTGQYPSTHGAMHNMAALPQDYPQLFAREFSNAGYFTHIVGKSHISPCHDPSGPESAPFIHNREYYKHWHGPWYGFQKADIAIGHSTEKHACGMHYGAWLEEQGIDTSKYFGHTEYEQYGSWDLPEEYHNSKWTADVVIDTIQNCSKRNQPFYCWANFQDPHNPCMVPEPWASMYDPEKLPKYGFKPGEPECFDQKPPFYKEIIQQPGGYAARPADPDMKGAGNICHLDWDQKQIQENAAAYYGMVSLIDHHVGRILDQLEASGQRDNTLVVFTSDHGECLGDHGFWWKSIVSYDESIRVPMIASYPGHIPHATQSDALHNLIDLMPTFLSFAGMPPHHELEGVDQIKVWKGESDSIRKDVIVEERAFSTQWNQRILVEKDYKLVFYANRNYGELYDRKKDPHQINNLWDLQEYARIKDKMIQRLLSLEMNRKTPRPMISKQFDRYTDSL